MIGDYIAVIIAKVFIMIAFILGMISLATELYTGSLPL